MPAKTEPKSGLQWGWSYGEDEWNTGMDGNLLKLGRFAFHLSVKDRDVSDPSTLTPADGDTYIVGPTAVGDWAGLEGRVVVWDATAQVWVNAVPSVGWIAWPRSGARRWFCACRRG
mgnify:CR=1 FL=1